MTDANLLAQVHERVGEMKADLRAVLADHKDLKTRVAKLENHWSKLTGALLVLGVPFTFLLSYLKRKLA